MSELIKLNVGCGQNILEGWTNLDLQPQSNDVVLFDMTKTPWPWADGSVSHILIEHGLEHVPCDDGYRILEQCYRVLAKGGALRICVPDVHKAWLNRSVDYVGFYVRNWGVGPIKSLATQHGHKALWNFDNLYPVLNDIGFSKILHTHGHTMAEFDGHWKVIGRENDDAETLRLEAIK